MLNRIFLTTSTLAMIASGVFAGEPGEPLSNNSITFLESISTKQLNQMTALVGPDFFEDIMALGDDPDNIQAELGQFSDALLNPNSFPTPLVQSLSLTSRIETLINTLGFTPIPVPSNSATIPYPQSLTGNIDTLQQRLGGHVNDTTTQRVGSVGGNLQKASLDAMIGVDVGGLTRRGLAEKLGNPLTTDQTLADRIGAPSGVATDSIYTRLGDPGSTFASLNTMIGVQDAGGASLASKLGNTAAASQSLATRIGSPSGVATESIYSRLGAPAKTDIAQTIGTTIATTISARLGDPGVNFPSLSAAIGAGDGQSLATQLIGSAGPDTSLLKRIGNPSGANPDADSIYTRLGVPAKTDLAQTIGTDRNTIADRLGDPGFNFASLSAAIGAGNSESLATQLVGTGIGDTSLIKRIGDPTGVATTSLYDRIGLPGTATPTLDGAIGVSGNGTIAQKLGNTSNTDTSIAARIGNPLGDATTSLYTRLGLPGTGTPTLDSAIGVTGNATIAQKLGNTNNTDTSLAARIGNPLGDTTASLYTRIGLPGTAAGDLNGMIGVSGNGTIAQKLGNTSNTDTSIAARIGDPLGDATTSIYSRLGLPGTATPTLANAIGVTGIGSIAQKLGNTNPGDLTLMARIGNPLFNTTMSLYDQIGIPGTVSPTLDSAIGVTGAASLAAKLGNTNGADTSLATRIGNPLSDTTSSLYDRLGQPGTATQTLDAAIGVSGSASLADKLGNTDPSDTSLMTRLGNPMGNSAISLYDQMGLSGTMSHNLDAAIGVAGSASLAAKLGNTNTSDLSLMIRIGNPLNDTTISIYQQIGTPGTGSATLQSAIGVSGSADIAQKLGNVAISDTSLAARIGTPSGATTDSLYTRLGAATVNGAASNLATVIGTTITTSLADRLGDPITFGSLSNIIGAGSSESLATQLIGTGISETSLVKRIGTPSGAATDSLYTRLGDPGSTFTSLDDMIGVQDTGGASLASKLGNTAASSQSLAARIGQPGVATESIYSRLGNPQTGTTGLARYTRNNITVNNLNLDLFGNLNSTTGPQAQAFNNAVAFYPQVQAFINAINVAYDDANAASKVLVFNGATAATSLADVLNKLTTQ